MTPETLAIARRVEKHPAFNRLTVGLRIAEPEPDTGGYGAFRVDGDEDGIWIRAADGSEWFQGADYSPPLSFSLWGVPDLDDAATVGVLLSQIPGAFTLTRLALSPPRPLRAGWYVTTPKEDGWSKNQRSDHLGQAVALAWLATVAVPKLVDTEEVSL